MIIKSVSFRNVLTYGNNMTTVILDQPGTTLIVGENADAFDGGSNGVGKTTAVLTTLIYGFYDMCPPNTTIDSLINNKNKKQMEVIIDFQGDNGKQYRIHRMRKMKPGAEGNRVHLYEDGVDITQTPNANTNKKIIEIIKYPYELFTQIVTFKAKTEGFLDMKGPAQKELIEEIFGLTAISAKAEKLKAVVKTTKKDLEHKKAMVEQAAKEHERHQQLIATAQRRVADWVVQNKMAVEALRHKLVMLENVDIEAERELHAELATLQANAKEIRVELKLEDRTAADLSKVINQTKVELSHLKDDKCPYCLQQYAEAGQKVSSLTVNLSNAVEGLADVDNVRAMLNEKLEAIESNIQQIQAKITIGSLADLLSIRDQASSIRRRIDEGESATNPYTEPLQELLDVKLEPVDYGEINKLDKDLKHQEFLLKLLTKNDSFVRKALLDKNLPFLNRRMKYYLQELGLPHSVEFTHTLDVAISLQGGSYEAGLMSTGQRARLHFALSLAFKDVRERLHGRVNLVVYDEVLDYGMDPGGVTACAMLIKHLARKAGNTTFVISHRPEIDGIFDHKMIVRMSGGFSNIVA